MPVDILSAIKFIIDVIKDIKNRPAAYAKGYAGRELVKLGAALDVIHFKDDGVLKTLRALVDDEPITQEQRENLFAFEPTHPDVTAALENIAKIYGEHAKLPLEERTQLARIMAAKADIRHAVSMFANGYAVAGKSLDREAVARVIAEIETLNSAIEEADRAIRK